MYHISLTQDKVALVDYTDMLMLSGFSWCYDALTGYAKCSIRGGASHKKPCQWMHRMLMLPAPGEYVHHINGNKLDNRRENLVIVSARENIFVLERPK